MPSTAVIAFGRYPRPGNVKTRLASTIGDDRAAAIYKACAEIIFSELEKIDVEIQRFFFFADESDASLIQAWVPGSFTRLFQRGAGLGERMRNAFAHAFRVEGQKSIIVGTDVPDITSGLIRQAIDALETTDVVVGPSHDGGYYLLGMRRYFPALLADIPWSSDQVLVRTLENIRRLELSYVLLPELIDIDTEGDFHSWLISKKNPPLVGTHNQAESDHPLLQFLAGTKLSKKPESV